MITNADIKQILVNNFNDIRMGAIQLFVKGLLERNNPGGGIDQFRIYNNQTDEYITSVDDFVAAIDEAFIIAKFDYYAKVEKGDTGHPISVTLTNLDVRVDRFGDALDNWLLQTYGNSKSIYNDHVYVKKINFSLTYLMDTDPALPLKIFGVRLT